MSFTHNKGNTARVTNSKLTRNTNFHSHRAPSLAKHEDVVQQEMQVCEHIERQLELELLLSN